MFLVILVNILYALVCPIGKIALQYTSPLFLTAFRMIFSGIVVLIYQYIFRRDKFTLSKSQLWLIALASIFSIYLTNWLEFLGLDYLTPAKTAFLYNLYPFSSALLSYMFFSERMSVKKWIGLAIGILGSLPLLMEDSSATEAQFHKYFGLVSLPELAVLGAIIACPLGWIFIQKAICDKNYDSVMANGTTMFAGGIMAIVHSYMTEQWDPVPITNLPYFFLTSFGLIIISNIICNTLYIELLKHYSLTFLSFTGFSTPLLTAVFDWLFFGYTVSYAFYISTAIMFVGFYLFYKEELKPLRET